MSDIKTPRGKRPFNSVLKSNTTVALPTIHKVLTNSQPNSKHNKSSYLQIAQNISCNVQYDNKNTLYINKEQDKLKSILKKMNYDTLDMIKNTKPHKMQRIMSKSQLSTLADKEVENSKKIISNLEYQINKLKEKYTRIIYHGEEQDVLQKIKIVRMEIQAMKHQNLEARLSVDKQGKTIVKEFGISQDPKIKIMQNDARFADIRLQKLRTQTNRVQEQTNKILNKLKQLESTSKSNQQEYNVIKSKQQEQISLKNKEIQMKEKNTQILNIKQKTQEKNTTAKQKYYKILRFIEQSLSNSSATESKIAEVQKRNRQLKEESTLLEAQLRQVKKIKMEKSRLLQDFLTSKQKIGDEDSRLTNEFVSENQTEFLRAERVKSQFDQLAQEKDLQRDSVQLPKKGNETKQKVWANEIKIVEQIAADPIQQAQIPKAIQRPVEILPQQVVEK